MSPASGSDQEEITDCADANKRVAGHAQPHQSGTGNTSYYWWQISNVAGLPAGADQKRPDRGLAGKREAIRAERSEHQRHARRRRGGDARWFEVPGATSKSRGKPTDAPRHILDNGGMLHENTGQQIRPHRTGPASSANGGSQLQAAPLPAGKSSDTPSAREAALRAARASNLVAAETSPLTSGRCSGNIRAIRTPTIRLLTFPSICRTSWSCGIAFS